jgi:xylulokinase
MRPGEVAATAGTSGVIYGLTDHPFTDKGSRVNTFAHIKLSKTNPVFGVLLCINGCGIMNSWIRKQFAANLSYEAMNKAAAKIQAGSEGLQILPFGNGAERMLQNKNIGAHLVDLNLTRHTDAHIFRAAQEGIAFAFRYGLDIMRENGMDPKVVRAGKANLFLSEVFTEAFVNTTELELEVYQNDGSIGAAIGAGIGAGIYKTKEEAFANLKPVEKVSPTPHLYIRYENAYHKWKKQLQKRLK